MAKVVITCPDRKGVYPFAGSAGMVFAVGETELELDDATIAAIEREIVANETIVTLRRVEAPKGKKA